MTAIETIEKLMKDTDTSLKDLADYSELGTKENVYQMLKRSDLKVGTFVKMLETLGFQLIALNEESEEEIVIEF